jgi:PAS domain-containing protein
MSDETTFQMLFDAHPAPTWVWDVETLRFLAVNEAAVLQYGYSRDEFSALTIRDIRPPAERARLDAGPMTRPTLYRGEWIRRRRSPPARSIGTPSRSATCGRTAASCAGG